MLKNMIFVMLGGGIGAVGRETLMTVVPDLPNGSYAAIFVANMTAAFLIGLAASLAVKGGVIGPAGKLLISTGIMGGLSTFSSFVWGADNMLVDPAQRLRGLLFIGASMILGFLLAQLGLWIGQSLMGKRLSAKYAQQ